MSNIYHEITVTAYATLTLDEQAIEDRFMTEHEDLCNEDGDLPEDWQTKHKDLIDKITDELAEEAMGEIYIGCGNGSTGGLVCGGSLGAGNIEFDDVEAERTNS